MSIPVTPPTLSVDSYKAGHFVQYPEALQMVAYGSCRTGYKGMPDDRLVMYGMDYIIDNYISRQWTMQDVEIAKKHYAKHNVGNTPYPWPEDLFIRIVEECNGYFPVTIQALPEGTVFHPNIPVYQIVANDDWSRLVTFLETELTQIWYPIAVATLAAHLKQAISDMYTLTVDEEQYWRIDSSMQDFGYRGCTCHEQSVIGGSAFLTSFNGSDTISAIHYANSLNLPDETMAGYSVPATEHSVMTAWPSELDAVNNMIEHFGHGVFACVADSYNYINFLNKILPEVAPKVKAKGGTMVIRPDSGDPVEMVILALKAAEAAFGVVVNKKGFKVLEHSAVLQGDGIDYQAVCKILIAVKEAGYSAQNVIFGMGGALLQRMNRDTVSFATKLNQITTPDGAVRAVMKAPITDSGKISLPGKLAVMRTLTSGPDGHFSCLSTVSDTADDFFTKIAPQLNVLKLVWDCGPITREEQSFNQLRKRIAYGWCAAPTDNHPRIASMQPLIDKTREELRQRFSQG
jgi:nicotinic acid phosphoribosyltransferase